jgi:hypothetical protein
MPWFVMSMAPAMPAGAVRIQVIHWRPFHIDDVGFGVAHINPLAHNFAMDALVAVSGPIGADGGTHGGTHRAADDGAVTPPYLGAEHGP